MAFDPFGDHATRGYLRNNSGETNPATVQRLEHHAFAANVGPALDRLRKLPELGYRDVLETHRIMFQSVYPWAGQDRATLAPDIAIGKAGHFDLFAHPLDIRRAVEYGLDIARDPKAMRRTPGEVLGILMHAHPFLELNGRTLMTVHTDLARRADIHVAWENIPKESFLAALTAELRKPGSALDKLLAPHIRAGAHDLSKTATDLSQNAGLNPVPSAAPGPSQRSPSPGF